MPGSRTYDAWVGLAAAGDRVSILAMLPRRLPIVKGDVVRFRWSDNHNLLTAAFNPARAVPPFGRDCTDNTRDGPCGDPGNAAPRTVLTSLTDAPDSGVLLGRSFAASTVRNWSVATTASTPTGDYTYICTIHETMTGTLGVS